MQRAPLFDLTAEAGRRGWQPTHDIARLSESPDGLTLHVSGGDPYAVGPPIPVPTGKPLWLRLRLRASESGTGQVFYFREGAGPSEADSVRFPVRPDRWEDVRVPLPALPDAPAYRFRIDPPASTPGATTTLALLDVEPRVVLEEPKWPAPPRLVPPSEAPLLRTGDVELRHGLTWGSLFLSVAGQPFAAGNVRPLIGYQTTPDAPVRWLDVAGAKPETEVKRDGAGFRMRAVVRDRDGGTWTLSQSYRPARRPGSIQVEASASVSAARHVAYLPWLTLLPGAGFFGAGKAQALFAGLEYLDGDEPSSSEADVTGPGALRHVPDGYQVTMPLMAIAARGRWLSLSWEPSPENVAAGFDSPDRRFNSGGHLMALLFPGTQGMNARPAGSLLPFAGRLLRAGETVTVRAAIDGGRGESVVPAVRAYVAARGLPTPPKTDRAATVRLLAAGWLDSRVHEGPRYRHAYPGDFGAQPAADAAYCQAWLAEEPTRGGDIGNRLAGAAKDASAAVAAPDRGSAAVGHVRTPAGLLARTDRDALFAGLSRAQDAARRRLAGFASDGSVPYQSTPGRPDYGRTHFAKHANGMAGEALLAVLDAALLTGDPSLRREGLARLRQAEALYRNSAPRGAQTWEVPLHTPDILAAAHLVRSFLRGHTLTGDARLKEAAVYWAWTGVPFVYLTPPVSEPVGLYASIAVYGATNWVAPNWIGLPVQWCGLVYADALYDLAAVDDSAGWRRLADGIVASGVQQTWPVGANAERQGLLPDSFNLPGQVRNDVAINPATLQVPYARAVGRPLYGMLAVTPAGPYVHAPGGVRLEGRPDPRRVRLVVEGWPREPYTVLLSAVPAAPASVRVNGRPARFDHRAGDGWLAVAAPGGRALIEVG